MEYRIGEYLTFERNNNGVTVEISDSCPQTIVICSEDAEKISRIFDLDVVDNVDIKSLKFYPASEGWSLHHPTIRDSVFYDDSDSKLYVFAGSKAVPVNLRVELLDDRWMAKRS